ncbi:MAG: PAS domain S-box protein [Spirochaetaceae bacterium]|nr:PAS domain S-box protein [Spirochaetaceae bacterium]
MEKERPQTSSLQNLLGALPDIVYILDGSGHFIYLNSAIQQLGWKPEELLGRHFTEILFEEDRSRVSRDAVLAEIHSQPAFPAIPPKLFDERRSGERMTRNLEVRMLHHDSGEIRYGLVNAYGEPEVSSSLSVVFSNAGPVTFGVIHDNTMTHLYQKSLEENLKAKELQLRETHHRVKNNLQVMASLAHLREMEAHDEATRDILSELIAQIKSMSIIHETLGQTENIEGVDAHDYFLRFAKLMEQTYGYVGSPVSLSTTAEACIVDAETLSFMAMIANELLSNAYRHAFPDKRKGEIRLSFSCRDGSYRLVVSDNGIGFGEQYKGQGVPNAGLGSEIVEALAAQLGGSLKRSSGQGTTIELSVPMTHQVQGE